MKLTSKIKHLHISPQKCRLVADLIRGLDVEKAEIQLKNLRKKACLPILKVLNTGIASAEHTYNMEKSNLYIKKIFVDAGTVMKRWKPRAFGRANPIIKRTSHITLVLDERVAGKKKSKIVSKSKNNKATEKPEDNKEVKESTEKDNKKHKFIRNSNKNNKPSKKGGVFKKMFRRKSI